MSSCLSCSGKILTPQQYVKQQQKEALQPDAFKPQATEPVLQTEALKTGGDRGTVLDLQA